MGFDNVPKKWMIDSLQMSKISYKVIKFIREASKNFSIGKNPERYLPGRCNFAITIAMIPLNRMIGNCTRG